MLSNFIFPLIRRSKISAVIDRQVARERSYVEKRYKEEIAHITKTMEQAHLLDLQEKDAEINSLHEHLKQLQKTVQDAEAIYLKAINMQKQARRISSDMKFQAEQALGVSIKFHQAMLAMSQTAENHEADALGDFEKNRKLLRGDR